MDLYRLPSALREPSEETEGKYLAEMSPCLATGPGATLQRRHSRACKA